METPEAVSVYLQPSDHQSFPFEPGQFVSLLIPQGDGGVRRAYSLASPAVPGAPLHITVKRVPGGQGSGWVNGSLHAGMRVRALGPSGSFHWRPGQTAGQTLVMLAGGSGITPIMSILHTALLSSDEIDIHLLYANRRWESIIFRERLERLEREHPGRLHILHVLEEPGPDTAAEVGRVHERQLQKWLSHSARSGDGVEYFLCGPAGMMDVARTSFEALGVDPERVRSESFQSPTVQKSTAEVTTPQTCIFEVDGTENRVMVASGQTLLEAGLDAGLSLPFSCALGGCGACRVKVVAGQVALQEPNCLTKEERDAGHALICVGRPTGPVRVKVEGPSHD